MTAPEAPQAPARPSSGPHASARAARVALRLSRFARRPVIGLVVLLVTATRARRSRARSSTSSSPPTPTRTSPSPPPRSRAISPPPCRTPSGIATAPDPRKPPGGDHVYSGATTDDSPDSTYEPDRDTRRPSVENYDDPFSPATAPFKRLRAYDWVDPDYSLRVRDRP
jgi:hypothetical protein